MARARADATSAFETDMAAARSGAGWQNALVVGQAKDARPQLRKDARGKVAELDVWRQLGPLVLGEGSF